MDQKTYVDGFHDKDAVAQMKYNPLGSTGLHLSEIGFGGAPIGGVYESFDEAEAIKTVQLAISSGINYIDTAPWYGQGKSEERLGKALKTIPRSAYFIATKVGRYETNAQKMFDFSAETVTQRFEDSLQKLGLAYVDIIQVHDIEFAPSLDIIVNETLPALQKLVDNGKARFIGITGYPLSTLKELYLKSEVKISCVLSYCRNTLFDNELEKYIPFFQEHNVGVINASIFSMGLLVQQGPQSWHPAPDFIKEGCLEANKYCEGQHLDIATLALKHSQTTKGITTHLLGMLNVSLLTKNLQAAQSPLTEGEKQAIVDIKTKFFSTFPRTHWEDVEVKKYRETLRTN